MRFAIARKAIKSKALVLTFDDGPGSRLTPAIMELLAANNAKATFFLLGRNIAGREEIVRQIAEQGHEICSHGYDHLDYWRVSPVRTIRDIRRGWDAVSTALRSRRCKYPFRPPNGRLNIISLLYLLLRRVPIVYWSIDLGDTWRQQQRPQEIAIKTKEFGGAVSLAHDFDRSDDGMDNLVLEATRLALAMAKEKNIKLLTYSQFINQGKAGEPVGRISNHS